MHRLALFFGFVLTLPAFASSPTPSAYEAYIEQAMKQWDVPGVAIGIVKDGKVVLARGFGVREAGKPTRMDERTLVPIASLTKGFTAASLAMLVDERKIAWDEPVQRYLPAFSVKDPEVSRALTVRDLAAHRSGLSERSDLLWYRTQLDRAEIIRRLRFLEQDAPLRGGEAYLNVTYAVLGEVVATRAGEPWEDVVRKRLLAPLGMTSTTVSPAELAKASNVATPHGYVNGVLKPIATESPTNIAPAAALSSNVIDMLRWLQLILGRGELDGRRVLSAAAVDELLSPQTLRHPGPVTRRMFPESHFMAFGLGWVLQDYRGRMVAWNTGGLDGVSCTAAILPEERFGIIVLSNYARTGFPEALVWRAIDEQLRAPEKDWSALKLQLSLDARKREAAAVTAAEKARIPGTRPSLELARYAGRYRQELLGELELVEKGGQLEARLNGWTGKVEHWHRETFRVTWASAELGTSFITFALDHSGDVARVSVETAGDFERVRS